MTPQYVQIGGILKSSISKLHFSSLELGSEKSRCSIFLITKVSPINEQFLTVNLKVKFVENGFAEEKVGEHLHSNCKLCCQIYEHVFLRCCHLYFSYSVTNIFFSLCKVHFWDFKVRKQLQQFVLCIPKAATTLLPDLSEAETKLKISTFSGVQ